MSTQSATPGPEPQHRRRLGLTVERKSGETVVIGEDVEITLLSVKGDRVHIGIVAPEGVPVARSEIYRERSRDFLT